MLGRGNVSIGGAPYDFLVGDDDDTAGVYGAMCVKMMIQKIVEIFQKYNGSFCF